ncbi:insulinase family protein [Ferrimonas gelatinilytica]|uniref:Protease 3 n=1 Tax=Ferrimonas gelatinilytica TaxID=1255257 RepID=A0ABP9S4Z0_9GAMM
MTETLTLSPNDPRQYRYEKLDNALRVLWVQDPAASKSAAALSVRVGHFDDPEDREGMAHFLEHMLFLGTERYPNAGEYQQFISQNGGSHNAWTGPEFTSYYFDIKGNAFDEALDRFSQFFTAPLFDNDLVEKERQSVDSEFKMKLRDDMRRFYQVHKETVNPAHPFSKFSVGNQQTLADLPDRPVREALLAFYRQHYSANLMTLVLVSPESWDDYREAVTERFGAIPNLELSKTLPDVSLYISAQQGIQIEIQPLKKSRQLTLSFALGAIDQWYRHKPLTYLSYMLGYEGPGSLLSVLKSEGLVSQLSAGGGVNGYNFKDYNISYQLTESGLANQDRILALTFQYIDKIRQEGIDDWRYRERQTLLQRAFRYQEPVKPLDLASHLTINMHHYDIEDIVFGDYRMDGLDRDAVSSILDKMNGDNCRLTLVAPECRGERKAKWYDTPYRISPIEPERRARWQAEPLNMALALPEANEYIGDLLDPRSEPSPHPHPVPIYRNKSFTLWHKKDDEFQVPKAHLFVSLDSEPCHDSPRRAALTRLYIALLLDSLSELTYQAEVAGLSYNIYPHQGGLTLHLSGFTGGQEKLLELLLRHARKRQFSESLFNETRAQLQRNWNGIRIGRPVARLFNALTCTLQQRSFDPLLMAEELQTATLPELLEHIETIYQEVHAEGMVYGDWLEEEARGLGQRLTHTLREVGEPGKEVKRQLVSIEGKGTVLREIESDHQDSAILVYHQSRANSQEKVALFSLLNHTISSDFFHELRTKQQLGYMVGTSYVPMNRCPGIIFYIQSPVAGPLQLLEAIDQFIADFGYALMQISSRDWESTKRALTHQLLEPDNNLKARAQRSWISIGNKDTEFDLREKIAQQIMKLDRADLIRFMMERMRCSNPDRLVLYSAGQSHTEHEPLVGERRILDIDRFKDQSNLIDF